MHNTSFWNLPRQEKMDIVQRGNQDAAVATLIGWLGERIRDASEQALRNLARNIIDDVQVGGRDAVRGIQASFQEFFADQNMQMTDRMRRWIRDTSSAVEEVANQAIQAIANEPGLDDPMNGRDAGGEMVNVGLDAEGNIVSQNSVSNSQGNAQVGQTRDRNGNPRSERRPRLRGNDEMDIEAVPEAARAMANGGSNNPVSKETPISRYPTLTYGLPETYTTVLPWTGWCTMVIGDTKQKPAILTVHMNRPTQLIEHGMPSTDQTTPFLTVTANTAFTQQGIFNVPGKADGTSFNTGCTYPATLATDGTGQVPQWLPWYAKQYEYYTVLGTEYEIVLNNVRDVKGASVLIGIDWDGYSDTATTAGNIMPRNSVFTEVLNYKNIQWHRLEANRNNENDGYRKVIRGKYTPGQVKRNIINDGDVKTWTKTKPDGTIEIPNLKEDMIICGWKDPLSGESTGNHPVNMQVTLKFIVQFKDLRLQLRYPHAGTTGQDVILNGTAATGTTNIRMKPGN